ncbi:MAG: response regulator transcription factor [Clostridia bacterium]|nr:response regulator transcription factor [Clostridia bacterium]
MIRVLIADDEYEAAASLRRNIEGLEDIHVAGIARDGREAVEACARLRPDVALLDIRMPGMDGIEAARRIKHADPEVKVILLTMFKEEDQVLRAVRDGCDGYLVKGARGEAVADAVKNACRGLATFDRGVQAVLRNRLAADSVDVPRETDGLDRLSPREIEIVRLMTAGRTHAEIAHILFLSEGYIRNQLVVIRGKLNLRNSLELVAWGAKMGL